jgi:predicted metal-dependent phosphoesterase TrpH
MVVADLHVHTTVSDGTLAPDAVAGAAAAAGLDAVAVTDHDRINPALSAPVAEREGVTVINGIELRVDAGDQRVDLLGYGVEPTPALESTCEAIQDDRRERARAIVECIEDRLGVPLDVDFRAGIGRPHIARAVADSDADLDYGDAFAELIGDDGPCYVPRDIPDFETGRTVLGEACALVGLAHPFRYDDPEAALALTAELDAVEAVYPYDREYDETPLSRAIEDHGLVPTGGSDAHGERVGTTGLDAAGYERVRKRLPRPTRG